MSRTHTHLVPLAGLLLLAAACTRLTPEQQLAHDVAEALGGVDRVQAADVLTLEGTGRQFNLGQDLRPGLADQTFTVTSFAREIDLAAPRMRTTFTRTPAFAYYQGPQAQTQVQGVDADIAYGGNDPAKATRASRAAAAERRLERLHHPLVVVRAALAEGSPITAVRTEGAERLLEVTTDAGPVTMAIGADNLPLRIETASSHPNLGDVTLTTTFSDYQDANGWHLPTHFATKVDDFTTAEYTVTTTAGSGSVAAPSEVAAAAEPPAPAVNITVDEVAPGVWFLAGQSHHSTVVAFKDRLVLIEAPQSEARSQAVIARARELRPGTPLTHLVMSHHHFDHSAGLRAAIAEGLTIVTHEDNEAFVREMAARPFTRTPDTLATRPAEAVAVEPVAATHTMSDGARTLELHHVAGNPHSDTMVMAWLPKERILIEVDAFSPGGSYHPYAANLLEHVQRMKWRVDRIVPLHGEIVSMKELAAAARPMS